eukprot:TRINITY_DN3475_c0_g1_i1.p2 TRINITY_DN3475_c0_g1~~TRINITY_DN3475_c0_g1_i1.p2  ORF type:complete len:232 (-),score=42.90 TRINITY_DN3475_c0_g1_i1:881-1510(-)
MSEERVETDYTAKVVLIGDPSTGKSAIFNRYLGRPVEDGYKATIGVDFGHRIISIGDKRVKLQLWDTAGQERFRSLTQSYYRGAQAMLFVFDVNNVQSFEHVKKWMADAADSVGNPNSIKVLIGNKIDLPTRQVDDKVAREYAETEHVRYMQVSAKDNLNIEETFKIIADTLPSRMDLSSQKIPSFRPQEITEDVQTDPVAPKKGCGCS